MTENSLTKKNALIGSLQVIGAGMCWGSLGLFSTYLNQQGFSGWQITSLRIITAALILLVLLPKLTPQLMKLSKKQWLNLSLQSLVGVLCMTAFYFFAVVQVGVAMAVALLYTAPVFSLILAHVFLNEKLTKQSILLAFMAFLGVMLTMSGQSLSAGWGLLLGLLSGVSYAFFGILGKKAMQENHSSLLVFYTAVSVSALILLFLPSTYATFKVFIYMPPQTWIYVLGLSVVGTLMPFWLYMKALEKLPATRASVFTIFEPLTAILLSVVLLSQKLTVSQTIGVTLIILAALLNAVLGIKKPRVS